MREKAAMSIEGAQFSLMKEWFHSRKSRRRYRGRYTLTISSTAVCQESSAKVNPTESRTEDIPQSPEDVTVCTPPNYRGGSPHFALDYMKPGKRKHPDEPILQESFSSKRQSTMIAEMEATSAAIPTVNDVVALNVMSRSHFSTGGFIRQSSMTQFHGRTAPSVIHIRDLPYFQFRRTMRSSGLFKLPSYLTQKLTPQML